MAITAQQKEKIKVEKEKKKKELIESIRCTSVTPKEFKKRLKEFNIKTVEELIKKAEKALGNLKLVEIVRNAPVNKDGKANLTKVHDQVFDYVFNETKDLQKAKEFATSARWMAMLKRDYPEEFDIMAVPNIGLPMKEPEPKPEPEKMEIRIGSLIDIITKTEPSRFFLRVPVGAGPSSLDVAQGFLEAITGIVYKQNDEQRPGSCIIDGKLSIIRYSCPTKMILDGFRNYLIQILEEKFGINIRICGFCKHFHWCETDHGSIRVLKFDDPVCEKLEWTPKEIPPEKKEEEK